MLVDTQRNEDEYWFPCKSIFSQKKMKSFQIALQVFCSHIMRTGKIENNRNTLTQLQFPNTYTKLCNKELLKLSNVV
jgi:hypothetical protein